MSTPADPAKQIVDIALAKTRRLPGPRVIAVDGPSGSGKSTLAGRIAELGRAPVVHMDDLYEGWTGLEAGVRHLVEGILQPVTRGEDGAAPRFDWGEERYVGRVEVAAGPLLVVEGVGCGARPCAPYLTVLVWVEAGVEQRLGRAVDRDGRDMRPQLVAWQELEERHHAAEDTRARADIRIET